MSKRQERIKKDGAVGHPWWQNPHPRSRMYLMVFWVCQRIGAQWREDQKRLAEEAK